MLTTRALKRETRLLERSANEPPRPRELPALGVQALRPPHHRIRVVLPLSPPHRLVTPMRENTKTWIEVWVIVLATLGSSFVVMELLLHWLLYR
jgi:hypothetical protein